MHIDIKPEDVDVLVRDGLGKVIEKAIQDVTKAGGYDNPIEEALKKYIANVALLLIEDKYKEAIKTAINDIIEKQVTQDLVGKTVGIAMKRMIDAAAKTRY